jgi:transposase
VVERSLAWLHQFRKLRIRDERLAANHEALLLLACSVISYRFLRT